MRLRLIPGGSALAMTRMGATPTAVAYRQSPGVTGAMVAFAAFLGVFATTPGQTVGVSAFVECGPGECPDNPTSYWLFERGIH